MLLSFNEKDFDKIIMMGDKVLVKPRNPQERTRTGLYLPPGVQEKEQLQSGFVIKTGPGYAIPAINDENDSWKGNNENVKYIPIQPQRGDIAIYLQTSGLEILFNDEKYNILPSSAIVMLIRDEGLLK